MVAMGVAEQLTEQLNDFVRSLQEQGMLDETFNHLEEVRKNTNPQFYSQLISTYQHEAQETLDKINTKLSALVIDFIEVSQFAHQLKSNSTTIGGCRMLPACHELYQACAMTDKEKCVSAYERVKNEYSNLRRNLDRISEMERAIPLRSNGVATGSQR